MTEYFSVYVYVEFKIRGNTAKLYFFKVLQKMYEMSKPTRESTRFHLSVSLTQWAGLDSDEDAKTLPWDGPGPNRVGGLIK